MASTYLSRTASTGNRKTFTLSTWLKRGNLSGSNYPRIFNPFVDSNNFFDIFFRNTDALNIYSYNSASNDVDLVTDRLFRDVSAWYHIVVAVDTTQSTSSDRVKLYVNGSQETSFSTSTYPSQNTDLQVNISGLTNVIGRNQSGSNEYFDGEMAHVHFIDGTAYDADTFGETDATTGIWKPKTAPSVTYGTNGFFLKFENSGAFGTDSSGNANNFTVNGTMTQTIDTPSNVFATMNALDNYYPSSTFSQGNNTIATASSNRSYNTGTLGASSGKYYWEVKCISNVTVAGGCYIGIASTNPTSDGISAAQTLGYKQYDYSYNNETGDYYTNNSSTSYGNSYLDNDIIGVAMDLDNNKLYFSKNGVWQNSGDPTSGATGTGAISIEDPSGTVNGVYTPGVGDWWVNGFTVSFNFGNGYFGTTQVSSAQNPDDGIGIFEYDVPTGYKALCTKSINAQEYD